MNRCSNAFLSISGRESVHRLSRGDFAGLVGNSRLAAIDAEIERLRDRLGELERLRDRAAGTLPAP